MLLFEIGLAGLFATVVLYWLAIFRFVKAYNRLYRQRGWAGPLQIWAPDRDDLRLVATLFRIRIPREDSRLRRAAMAGRTLFVLVLVWMCALFFAGFVWPQL